MLPFVKDRSSSFTHNGPKLAINQMSINRIVEMRNKLWLSHKYYGGWGGGGTGGREELLHMKHNAVLNKSQIQAHTA